MCINSEIRGAWAFNRSTSGVIPVLSCAFLRRPQSPLSMYRRPPRSVPARIGTRLAIFGRRRLQISWISFGICIQPHLSPIKKTKRVGGGSLNLSNLKNCALANRVNLFESYTNVALPDKKIKRVDEGSANPQNLKNVRTGGSLESLSEFV